MWGRKGVVQIKGMNLSETVVSLMQFGVKNVI